MSFTLSITVGTTTNGVPLEGPALFVARDAVTVDLVETFGGVTLTHGFGSWKDPRGVVVSEPVDIWTIHTSADGIPWREHVWLVCRLYKQESVALVKVENVRFEIVEGD